MVPEPVEQPSPHRTFKWGNIDTLLEAKVRNQMSEVLHRLAAIIEARKQADPKVSYVAKLLAEGRDAIVKKVGEEATETIVAGKNGEPAALVHETADLWFHTLVLLADCGLGPEEVLEELERRFGTSGLDEKLSRSPRSPTGS